MARGTQPAVDDVVLLEGLRGVSRLAPLKASDVLDVQVMGLSIPDSHIRSLLEASLLLKVYGVDLPPQLGQIMQRVDNP